MHAAMLHLRIFRTGSVTSVATDEVKMPVSFEYFVVSLLPDHRRADLLFHNSPEGLLSIFFVVFLELQF